MLVVNGMLADIRRTRLDKILTSKYSSGTSWYRIYADGWIEQGGVYAGKSGVQTNTITLLKNFANTNYSLIGVSKGSRTSNSDYQMHLKPLSTSQFEQTGQLGTGFFWQACGY